MLKNNYVVYSKDTGQITLTGQSQQKNIVEKEGFGILYEVQERVYPDSSRVDLDTLTVVPRLEFSEGSWDGEEYTQPLPEGSIIYWQGIQHFVDDGSLTVLVDQPGAYNLIITHPLYMTKEVSLEDQ